jgi:hypothetical protein
VINEIPTRKILNCTRRLRDPWMYVFEMTPTESMARLTRSGRDVTDAVYVEAEIIRGECESQRIDHGL